MSLIDMRWIVVAGAGVLAVAVPAILLRSGATEVAIPPPLVATEIGELQTAGLSYAITAPPFDPDRTPGVPAPAGEAQPAAAAPVPMPRLVGLVTGGRGRSVALVRTANGETLTLAPGEEADGWRLVSVGRDQAVFDLGGSRQTATLDFSNKAGPESAPVSPGPAVTPAAQTPSGPSAQ